MFRFVSRLASILKQLLKKPRETVNVVLNSVPTGSAPALGMRILVTSATALVQYVTAILALPVRYVLKNIHKSIV